MTRTTSVDDRPKLGGSFVPLAFDAYNMLLGSLGALFEGTAMNRARAFGPDVAPWNFGSWRVYFIGPFAGAAIAVLVAHVLRGPAKAQEARAAMGDPSASS